MKPCGCGGGGGKAVPLAYAVGAGADGGGGMPGRDWNGGGGGKAAGGGGRGGGGIPKAGAGGCAGAPPGGIAIHPPPGGRGGGGGSARAAGCCCCGGCPGGRWWHVDVSCNTSWSSLEVGPCSRHREHHHHRPRVCVTRAQGKEQARQYMQCSVTLAATPHILYLILQTPIPQHTHTHAHTHIHTSGRGSHARAVSLTHAHLLLLRLALVGVGHVEALAQQRLGPPLGAGADRLLGGRGAWEREEVGKRVSGRRGWASGFVGGGRFGRTERSGKGREGEGKAVRRCGCVCSFSAEKDANHLDADSQVQMDSLPLTLA